MLNKILEHTIEPYYNESSRVLILGSFPSIKSREVGFYYSHPKNRFWKVLALTFKTEEPITIEEKKNFLNIHYIALFDVCKSCSIKASSDASIKNVIPNNLDDIMKMGIKAIFFDGKTAYNLYLKYFQDKYNVPLVVLPSTSPANAKFKLNDLIEEYNKLVVYCE